MQTEIKDLQALLVYKSRILVRPGLGLVTGLAGIANMGAAIVPKPNWDMLLGAWPGDTHHGAYKLTAMVLFLYAQLKPFGYRYGIEEVLLRLFTNSHLGLTHGTEAFFFGHALPVLCLSAVLYGIVMILRPVAAVLFPTEQEWQAASTLTHIYGRNSISYFALSADKSYFFSASRKSVIAYVLEGNVAVAAGY